MSANCVCGCPESDHIEDRISVELEAKEDPIYKLPASPWNINRPLPGATYLRRACKAGHCMDYLADT